MIIWIRTKDKDKDKDYLIGQGSRSVRKLVRTRIRRVTLKDEGMDMDKIHVYG